MMRIRQFTLLIAAFVAAAAPASAGGPASGEVTGVSVLPSPGRAEIVINVRGAVDIKDFVLREPSRVVIDVMGAHLNGTAVMYDGVNRGGVLDVKYSQFRPDVVRVAIYLTDLKNYTVDRGKDAIRLSFGSDREFLAWSSSAPADLAAPRPAVDRPRPEVAVAADRPAPAATGDLQQPRLTVTWDKADISDVVSGFAAFSGRTIILGKDIKGTVSAEIKNQPWPAAFQAVLATQGLQAVELPGGIIRVDSPQALAALDSIEPLQTRVVRINYAAASALVPSVKGMLTKRGNVVSDTTTNSLIFTDTRSRIEEAERFVRGLDVRTRQVSIQSKLIFVDRTDVQQLGLQYDLGADNDGVFFNKILQRQNTSTTPSTPYDKNTVVVGGNSVAAIANADGIISGSALDLVWRTALGGFSLTTFLHALETVNLADVQAEPLISTMDNRQASIVVGEDVPLRTIDVSSATTGTAAPRATVTFRETGIKLQVTPHVTNNRQILMQLHAERSSVTPLAAADLGFTISKQSADNQLLVADGETAVIGGLTVTQVTKSKSGIPFLVDLPIVGKLFGFSNDQQQRRDLIILVTPRIIDDGAE
jgi:type IV pilus assembly protein PilQ